MSCKIAIKKAKSKAFKNGRKVGYWLAMQNIEKSKHKNIEDKTKLNLNIKLDKKLEVEEQKGVSVKSKPKKKLEVEEQKGVSVKSKPKKPKKILEVEQQKGVSVLSKKPKKNLEVEDQKGVSKKGISKTVKDFLESKVPTKKILHTEDLPSINIDSTIMDLHDKNMQTEEREKIDLAIEENKGQTIHPEYDDDNLEYYYDNSGPGIEAIIIESEPEEIQSEEIDYAFDILNQDD